MPSTINGIGTTYYGKGNVNTRSGVCEHCKAQAAISSYETRLWFVVLFIPIIPLGKKQILDQCSACTRHRVVPLGEWERVRDEATGEATAKAGRDPNDPEAAMEMLGSLVAFQKHQEAQELADQMATRFPDNADVQFQLGAWHDTAGRTEKADACFERALQLEPENRMAARAVGIGCIPKGDLARARKLLSFLETSGPEREPAVLVLLADAFQAADDHKSASELYGLAVDQDPSLARDKGLRKRANASATAIGVEELVPEPPKNYNRRLAWLGGAFLLVAAATAANYYAASNQTLHLVNGLPEQVTVVIDDEGDGTVVGPGRTNAGDGMVVGPSRTSVKVAEGKHRAVIRRQGGSEETVEFEIENSIFQRFSSKTVFVLNVAGAANLLWQEALYTVQPDPNAENPYRVHFAEEFLTFRGVDYPFEEFPDEISMEGSSATRSRVGVLDAPPLSILMMLSDPPEMLRFAEHHLTINPADEMLLQVYSAISMGSDQTERCRAYLGKGVSRKPVAIEWHRMYQEMARSADAEEALISQYEGLLKDDPDNSALLYLRGRLASRATDAEVYFDRAIEADPKNAYPYFAKSYYLDSMGEYTQSKELASKAAELKPGQIQIEHLLFEIRFALGEFADLESELRESLAEDPMSGSTQQDLLRVLVADNRVAEARTAHDAFAAQVNSAGPNASPDAIASSLMNLEYFVGNFEAWLAAIETLSDPEEVANSAPLAHFELGRLDDLGDGFAENAGLPKGYSELLLSLAWRRQEDEAKAKAWREKAIEVFASGTLEETLIADLFRKGDQLDLGEVDEVLPQRWFRAILLVALADAAPAHRKDLLTQAEKLNVVRYFPYQFLKRTIDTAT